MIRVVLTERAHDDLRRIDRTQARKILKKLSSFAKHKHPLTFAKRITDSRLGTYRFRVGDYRILFDVNRDGTITILLILTIKHRRNAYML